MSNDPNDTAISAYSRVFSATSAEPLSAKSIATATGLPYKDVTAHLATLLEQGQVEQAKDGSRTVWTRAAHVPAGAVPDEPLSAGEVERLDGMHDAADAPVAAALSVADVLATLGGQKIESLKRDALVSLCADLGVSTNPRDTKAKLIEVVNARIAELQQRERDAARPDYAGMKVAELRAAAKDLKVPGSLSKMARADLIVACDTAWDVAQEIAEVPAVAETPAPAAESVADAAVVPDGPWGSGNAGDAPTGSVSAVLADLQSARPVSAPPAQSATPRRTSNRPAGGVVSSGAAPAWTRGQCEATLLGMLQAKPDDEHSATSLVKEYNATRTDGTPVMQPGSTAFALDAMVKKGKARLTQASPKRYAAMVVPIPSA